MFKKQLSMSLGLLLTFGILPVHASTTEQAFTQLLKKHYGQVIYLDFWASWCGPCRKSFPWMNDLKAKYKDKGLVVLSVNVDNDKSFATEFLEQTPANFNVFYDPKGEIAKKYKLKGMPSSYILNRKGKLVAAHAGFSINKISSYEQEIEKQLNAE